MQEPEQQRVEQQQPEEQRTSGRWQNRICNALTLVGLVAVVIVGGSSILADVEHEIATPSSPSEESVPTTQETFEPLAPEPLPMPEPVVEEETVDSLALDTALNLTPESELVVDSVATHPATHATESAAPAPSPATAPADSTAHSAHNG